MASSVFHNKQREDVYWLSREGRLRILVLTVSAQSLHIADISMHVVKKL